MKTPLRNLLGLVGLFSLLGGAQAASGAVAKWQGLLSNQKLVQTVSVGSASLSFGGASLSSGAVKNTTELHLCKDGSFLRVETTSVGSTSMGSAGSNVASPPVNNVEKASGKWKIVSADSVHVNILLTPSKATDLMGNDRKLDISFDGANTMVNGERWNRMKSPICR